MTVIVERRERTHSAGCCAEALPVRLSAEAVEQFSEELHSLAHPMQSVEFRSACPGGTQVLVASLGVA